VGVGRLRHGFDTTAPPPPRPLLYAKRSTLPARGRVSEVRRSRRDSVSNKHALGRDLVVSDLGMNFQKLRKRFGRAATKTTFRRETEILDDFAGGRKAAA